MAGIGLLPISTTFEGEKVRTANEGTLSEVSRIFEGLSGKSYRGYEIHMGVSGAAGNIINSGNVYGTYIHSIFDRDETHRSTPTSTHRTSQHSLVDRQFGGRGRDARRGERSNAIDESRNSRRRRRNDRGEQFL